MSTNPEPRKSIPSEDPAEVSKKAQAATKVLADSIALKYQNIKNQTQTASSTANQEMDLKANKVLDALAQSVAHKFNFVQEQRKEQGLAPIPVAAPSTTTTIRETTYNNTGFARDQAYSGQGTVSKDSKLISEKVLQPRITTNVTENIRGSHHPNARPSVNNQVKVMREEGLVHTNIVDKKVDVVIERPVVNEIVVERPYEVIVQRPVENIIEREVVTEKYIENPVERIIEHEVENIIERKVEQIVEKPKYVEQYIDRQIENVIEREVQQYVEREVPVRKSVKKTVEKTVLKPFRNEIQTKEVIVEKPYYEDVIIERPVEKVYEVIQEVREDIYVDKEYVREVERPVRRDVYVEALDPKSHLHHYLDDPTWDGRFELVGRE